MTASSPTSHPAATTLGELRASGHVSRGVADELRENLLLRLRAGEDAFPGIVGFEDTVLPELESALLAGHDIVLLGERGQGKTRIMRTLVTLLDEWTPEVAGCEIHDDPYAPVCVRCQGLLAAQGDDLAVAWRHRDDRYTEKLATPDTSVGDLIGDVDPVKVAQGRTLGDPETVHYGLVPRANRGLFGLNELPDLAERIQVALFNVLEERDIQVRGYSLRLPLDVFLVATANPEDYTNRGRIITPLKDRFGAEIRTHYLSEVSDEVTLLRQEAGLVAEVGDHLLEVLARFVHLLRESSSVDQRSGVSARFAIAAAEGVAASALRRAARTGDSNDAGAVARVCDLGPVLPTLLGKIEFEMGEEGRERAVLDHLLRLAVAATFRERLSGLDLSGFTSVFAEGAVVETGDLVPAADVLSQLGTVPGLAKVLDRLGYGDAASRGQVAAAVEFVLEGLHLTRRIEKETVDGRTVYGAA
ncbi:sigma 54-interacting transcriptional regulator [Microlunatus antarcticus]|uniref:Magnesium chelatase subunit I n=1 Tax=Microlunatus antarcticus TaxID=53388 RepID=A0A7W5JV95_9ACTN|nr:sigma 54-interacting transcriptional regulator [Microlunatus antarcticus]MBB3326666.1 magnesium chelatase subunit I [Microlunatus antarcticus]